MCPDDALLVAMLWITVCLYDVYLDEMLLGGYVFLDDVCVFLDDVLMDELFLDDVFMDELFLDETLPD